MSKKKVKKLLVLGWDAAEWKVMEPMMEQGLMPTLKKFLSEGVSGKIATLDPPFSPMLWTSIATGKRAYDHGIMGFIEPTPDGDALRAVQSTSRKVKAIWNILNQTGHKSNVIGWWPSHPAEPINGVMVSNFFQNFKEAIDKPWPMLPGTVHPKEKEEEFAKLRVHPDEMTVPILENFVPDIVNIMEKYSPIDQDPKAEEKIKKRAHSFIARVSSVSKNVAQCASIHNAGTYVLRTTDWDFTAIYYDTIDHFSHIGMKFHPPRRENIQEEPYEAFKDVVTGVYRYHDMMLERILNLVDEDTTIMILSDHGFHPDNLRPTSLPDEPASPALEHSPFGMFAIKGPGIKKGEKIYGASLLDVTPTILHLYGLPIGEDMEGKVLQQIFEPEVYDKVEKIPTWETVAGDDARHSDTEKTNTWASQEAMQQLIDLGYIEKPEENMVKAIENAVAEAKYYLARSYINGNKYKEAIEILEELDKNYPNITRYGIRLANSYIYMKRYLKCEALLERIKTIENYPKYKVQFIEGLLYINTFKIRKAIKVLDELKSKTKAPNVFLNLGRANNLRYRWDEAEKDFKQTIELDPTSSIAYHGLGVSYLRRNQYEKAIDALLMAIEIHNDMPQAHFCLGEALMKMNLYKEAADAFNMTLYFQPKMIRAHFWLGEVYAKLNQPELAKKHTDVANSLTSGERFIVSGLQRSGTSLLMQLFEAAGLPIIKDNERPADEFNPQGYYEYKPAHSLNMDKTWLKDIDKSIVKVYAQSIIDLPKNYRYKVIWMERPMEEILSSYNKMEGLKDSSFNAGLADKFSLQVDKAQVWLESFPNAEMMIVNYNELIENPMAEMEEILAFLEIKSETLNLEDKLKNVIKNKVSVKG